MAYFPNGRSGMAFSEQCAICRYGEKPCPIAWVQMEFNYDQCNNPVAEKILDHLVKTPGRCAMFEMDPQTFATPGLHVAEEGASLFDPSLGPPAPIEP